MMCRSELFEDSLQQRGKHEIKHKWFEEHGVIVEVTRFDGAHAVPVSFGDYYRDGSNVVVDTKRNIQEIAQNINGRNHDRFKRECVRAQGNGYRLVVLVENRERVRTLRDLSTWVNDHCRACGEYRAKRCNPNDGCKCFKHGTRKPIQGGRLAKAMETMQERYGVRFEFCTPHESAKRICDLLGVIYEQNAGGSTQAAYDGVQDTPDKTRD